MAIELPHLAAQFAISRHGPSVVEQGTSECRAARIFHTAVCPEGYREDEPSFGVPELAFEAVPLDLVGLEAALLRWEPEAVLAVNEQAEALNQALRQVGVEVT